MMQTADFDYDLPDALIAQAPLAERDACRLLVLDRRTGARSHRVFRELPQILRPGDLLVVNDSRVLPARLYGRRPTGGRVEILLTRRIDSARWFALTRPGVAVGKTVEFSAAFGLEAEEILPDGQRLVRFNRSGPDLDQALHQHGELPVPPYVKTHRWRPDDYQTVYAQAEGSVAAPTAGLHFTPDLLDALRQQGIQHARITLHVGIGTFRPIKVADPAQHHMHAEWFRIDPETADRINQARREGRRIVAVGTTVVRTLEGVMQAKGRIEAGEGDTELFIRPGFHFQAVDALITNFHLPKSTLLMLVSAFAGREPVLAAYAEAVTQRYRFYSFGDAMLISS